MKVSDVARKNLLSCCVIKLTTCLGGLDGLDVFSDNIWVHDVEVTSKLANIVPPCILSHSLLIISLSRPICVSQGC